MPVSGATAVAARPRSTNGALTRVLIVDDHPMVRDIIRLACSDRSELEVIGEAGTGPEALDKCRTLSPDVLVLDLGLPGISGLDVIRQLRREESALRILVVSGRGDRSAIFESARVGADGYLEKTGSVQDIAAAVEAVASGTQVFSVDHQRIAHEVLGELARKSREAAFMVSSLTRRERQILQLIAQGLTSRQMASTLGVSQRTVETHVANLYDKLDVRTRVQAVHRGIELGLIVMGEWWRAEQNA